MQTIRSDKEKRNAPRRKRTAKHIAMLGVSVALAMVLSYLESLIPPFLPVPGIRMGLANILTVFLLYRLSPADAAGVSLVRILLSALLFGNTVSLFYSLAGGVCSFLVMFLLFKSGKFHVTAVSVAGGVAHNIAQVAVAAVLMRVGQIVYYLPVLLVSGTLAGIAVGAAGVLAIKKVRLPSDR